MKKRLCFLILLSFLAVPKALAQEDDDDDLPPTDDPPPPTVPIDNYIPVMFVLGIVYAVGFVKFKKENN